LLNLLLALALTSKWNKHDGGFPVMKPLETQAKTAASESGVTLETIISIGVLGWLTMGMVLMGLGIW
jgi:hypothetical protein